MKVKVDIGIEFDTIEDKEEIEEILEIVKAIKGLNYTKDDEDYYDDN